MFYLVIIWLYLITDCCACSLCTPSLFNTITTFGSPKDCWNLAHHDLSCASINGKDLSLGHCDGAHREFGSSVVHGDATSTSHTWPPHSASNHSSMTRHATCLQADLEKYNEEKWKYGNAEKCCTPHACCTNAYAWCCYGELFSFPSVVHLQKGTDSPPLVVRTPSAACKPWMSSGLVSIRTRITLSPSLLRRTASSAEKTTLAEICQTACPAKSHSTKKISHEWHIKYGKNFESCQQNVKSIRLPFVQIIQNHYISTCIPISSNIKQSICKANVHSKTTVNNGWTMGRACALKIP